MRLQADFPIRLIILHIPKLHARKGRTQNILKKKQVYLFMEKVRKEESKSISKRLLFFHVVEILYEQGFLREDEKNRMRVILTQIQEKEGACHGTCSNL